MTLSVPHLPERYLLDLATKCNLRCPMCPVWGSEDNVLQETVKGVMPLAAAQKVLDEIMRVKPLVQPNMYGEPLLAPRLRERIIDMKRRGIAVAMNTNGLTLDDELAQFFVDVQLDSIFFSIDAVTESTLKKIRGIRKLERIEVAVLKMLQARGEKQYPRVGVSFTEQDDNRHERDAFIHRWVHVVDCVRIGLLFENGRFKDMPDPGPRKPCPSIYHTMPIHNDGQVTVCCLDGFKQTNMGNVFKDGGVEAVWQGKAFQEVRHYHETGQWDKVPFCENCNGWAQYEFTEEVRDGLLIRKSPQFVYYNKISRLANWQGALLGGHPEPTVREESLLA
ncbi:MAG: hypothetical protein A3F41_07280 [Coxiella sp. RIFCSPHIGHO2_12_FULL_44_14]|nr:MAG: hypothetical protein A3F41_07280 [Coxiella sp. RIFCSPHIGHO2_12_FULL_44_14]